jgi:hypothetical protein
MLCAAVAVCRVGASTTLVLNIANLMRFAKHKIVKMHVSLQLTQWLAVVVASILSVVSSAAWIIFASPVTAKQNVEVLLWKKLVAVLDK